MRFRVVRACNKPYAHFVTKPEGCHGTEEAATLKDRDDITREVGEVGASRVEVEGVLEAFHGEHTADETGVPSTSISVSDAQLQEALGLAERHTQTAYHQTRPRR